jgi:hypothetical protein
MLRERVAHRLTGLFVRWNLIGHPYGREYALERYSVTGRRIPVDAEAPSRRRVQFRAAALAATMVLLSLLAAGVLFAST